MSCLQLRVRILEPHLDRKAPCCSCVVISVFVSHTHLGRTIIAQRVCRCACESFHMHAHAQNRSHLHIHAMLTLTLTHTVFPLAAAEFVEARGISTGTEELPPPELRNLSRIATALHDVNPFVRDRYAEQALAPGYLRSLLDIFHVSSLVFRGLVRKLVYVISTWQGRSCAPSSISSMQVLSTLGSGPWKLGYVT